MRNSQLFFSGFEFPVQYDLKLYGYSKLVALMFWDGGAVTEWYSIATFVGRNGGVEVMKRSHYIYTQMGGGNINSVGGPRECVFKDRLDYRQPRRLPHCLEKTVPTRTRAVHGLSTKNARGTNYQIMLHDFRGA